MDRRKLLESFIEAWCDRDDEEKKKQEFDFNFSLLCTNIIPHLAATFDSGSDLKQHLQEDVLQLWKDLINIIRPMPLLDPKEPSKSSPGSKLKELENLNADGDQQTTETQSVGGHNIGEQNITYSNHTQYYLSSSLSISNNINGASPNPSIPLPPHQVDHMRPHTDSVTIENMPIIIPSHIDQSPHEETKVGFTTVFAVEVVGALSNFAVSSTAKEHYSLIYAVVATSTIAFIISSTALILHKKRPEFAKKMQKAAFVFGVFGFMGILGLHFPVSIMWWFTISAFVLCMLMFAVATYVDVM
ncbi:uncharacterized protein G2W53_002004 [Senna tora]|uniref:Uncharacterized protein n=1 Tax=Senna tora TaxID=362788 RepID=A0A835CJY2_9FABA|nr:uncharacterized protein G2W53_002004 [Senna tora]